MEFSPDIYLALALLGFVAGCINAMAGGAGMVVLPVMLWLGIPPLNALATGKFQATVGTLASAWNYSRGGFLEYRLLWPLMILAVLASALGTMVVQQFSNAALEKWLPYLLITMALYILFAPGIDDRDRPARIGSRRFTWIVGPGTGFYAGFFGPNVGAITTLLFSTLLGYNLRRAAANAKPVIFACNLTSVLVFLTGGHVLFTVGLCMAATQVLGAYVGSTIAIKKGAVVIRPLMVVMSIAIASKLLYDTWF